MKSIFRLLILALASASFFIAPASAQNPGTVTNHAFLIGKGAGTTGYTSLLCGSAQLAVGQSAADPICRTMSGDATLAASGALTLATVNSNVGSFGSATQCPVVTVNGKGLITAASATTCTPAIGSVTGLGSGVATFLATPSSANLLAALTTKTGTGNAVFGTSPTISNPNIVGTATNDNAAAGSVGEYVSSDVVVGSAVALTTATPANVTSISLTAGDWEVSAMIGHTGNTATTVTQLSASLSTTSATLDTSDGRMVSDSYSGFAVFNNANTRKMLGPARFSLSGTTTVYLVTQANFAVNTCSAFGILRARRVR